MSSPTPVSPTHIRVPLGMKVIETPDGFEVVRSDEAMTKTVAIRMPSSMYADLMVFVETFPSRGWGEALRWLFSDERVRSILAERATGFTRPNR